jgi:hypothetical protein
VSEPTYEELREENNRLKAAASVLCEVHTRERDGMAAVEMGAKPEFWHDHKAYVEAWLTLRKAVNLPGE